MEAVVLAGGFGTRLQKLVNDVPKSMALINGKPFLEFLLNYLTGQGVDRVVLSVGYKNEMIQSHFKDKFKHLQLVYAYEEEPLGTGGGIKNAFSMVEGELAFVLNGDSMFRIDLNALMAEHRRTKADITLALRYLEDTERFGTVVLDDQHHITGFREKNPDSGAGYINAGVYVINKQYILQPDFPAAFSIEKDCFEKYFSRSNFVGHPAKGYFLDIGIPEDYMKAQDEFRRFED